MISRRAFLASLVAPKRPNLLLILADDLGWSDLSCFGARDIHTPNLDSLARDGARFRYFYAAPECSPTRASLLTGRYQQRVGGLECAIGTGNVGRYDEAEWLAAKGELGLPVEETSIARMLKNAGYATCCSGKWHLGYDAKFSANGHGFDEYFGILGGGVDYFTHREDNGTNVLNQNGKTVERAGHMTDLIADHALGWLAKRPKAQPFFHYIAFTAPHAPLQGPGDHPLEDKTKWNAPDRKTYAAMVEHMDRRVGDLLRFLDKNNLARNTLVVFLSDNGGALSVSGTNGKLRGGKSSVWEGGIRVPCVMRYPGVIPEGSLPDQVGIAMDITETLLAAANVHPSRPLDAVDLLPVLTGKRKPFPRTLFWSYKRGHQRRWAVREAHLKYVIDNGVEGLFDLIADEGEQTDLIPSQPALAAKLRAKLEAWKRETAPARLIDFKPEIR